MVAIYTAFCVCQRQLICSLDLHSLTSIGCILLSVGQARFHGEAMETLNYVVNQSEYTVDTLRNVTEYLSLAKTVSVAQIFLPSDVKDDIDRLTVDLNAAADKLELKTDENSGKIRHVFNTVYDVCHSRILECKTFPACFSIN